jgi:DNA polymerase-3 subunit delta
MTWQELWRQLDEKKVAPCYLLWGEEEHLLRLTVAKIEEALALGDLRDLNYERLDAQEVDGGRLESAVCAFPWLAPRRLVVLTGLKLAGTDKGAGTREEENKVAGEEPEGTTSRLERELLDLLGRLPATTCLVLVASGPVDIRRRLVKAVAKAGVVQEFPRLKGQELERWLKERGQKLGLKWERGAAELLAARGEGGLVQLEQELKKLAAYTEPSGVVRREDVELLVPEAKSARVFDLIDAVLAGESERALHLLSRLLEQGETPLGLVALLARQVRLIMAAKEAREKGNRPGTLAAVLKVHPYVAQKLEGQSSRFTWEDLYRLIQALARADQKLKSSTLSPNLILEEIILGLSPKGK